MDYQEKTNKELCIFVTENDKRSTDISTMSNFFDNCIGQFCNKINSNTMSDMFFDIPIADIAIISDVLKGFSAITNGAYEYIVDFDSLPNDISRKVKQGIYKIGESRQIDGNFRAVIMDENNVRVKDLTLKQIKPDMNHESLSNIMVQLQLKQIYTKLTEIQELQTYQIELERNANISTLFLNVRDNIVAAQDTTEPSERQAYLKEADKELAKAINFIYGDIDSVVKNLAKMTNRFIQLNRSIEKFLYYLLLDLQLLIQFIGVRVQVLSYLDNNTKIDRALSVFNTTMSDFFTKGINKKNQPAIKILHDYYPYTNENRNCWWHLSKEYNDKLAINTKHDKKLILITVEDTEK